MEYETTERESRVSEIRVHHIRYLSKLGDGKLPSEAGVTTLQG